jgi:MiaB/RimO family radical SAM methylthiotransferase
MKSVFIGQGGFCWPSRADYNLLINYFDKNGWSIVDTMKAADLILIYTCAHRRKLENYAIELIERAKKTKKASCQIIVAGCLPTINKARLKKIFDGKTVSARSLGDLDEVLHSKFRLCEIGYAGSIPSENINIKEAYPLRIGWGCRGQCTYCAVRFVFGKPLSRSIRDILDEYDIAYEKGYRKFMLIANDAAYYGEDLNLSLHHLFSQIIDRHSDSKFGLSYITVDRLKDIFPELGPILKRGKIWNVKITVESGNDRIIDLMGRRYKVKDFSSCVKKLFKLNPDLEVETNLIVGFPTETEKEFRDTMKLVTDFEEHNIIFFPIIYSDRPNTASSKMQGKISRAVKEKRFMRLRNLCKFVLMSKNKKGCLFSVESIRKPIVELKKLEC